MTTHHTIRSGLVKIYFNDLLHLCFYKNELGGIQSWIHGPDFFVIEITTSRGVISTEYDRREKWEQILKELDLALP